MAEVKEENEPVLPWMRNPIDLTTLEQCPLDELPFLDPRLKPALEKMGVSSLFEVQVAVWVETIGPGGFERDICVSSLTGSGKTLAYALPIVQALSKRAVKCLRALVVLPTRDLAIQVKDVFSAIAPAVGLSVGLAVGQSSVANEISQLIKRPKLVAGICYDPEYPTPELESAVDILVATPGRLMDHISNTKGFTLGHLQYLVVDEADRLLRESYQSWLPTVLKMTASDDHTSMSYARSFDVSPFSPIKTRKICGIERGFKGKPYPRLAKFVLSATLTRDPSKLAQLDLHHPLLMTTGSTKYLFPENLKSFKVICQSHEKPLYLVALLQSLGQEKCIVFTSSVVNSHRLYTLLNFFADLKMKIGEYSNLQHQSLRSKTLTAFRAGEIQVLVSSDGMTRGMDVEGLKIVINYDKPNFIKTYIHRAGRTARAGHEGRCYTLVGKQEVKQFKKMLQAAGKKSCAEHPLPSELVNSLRPVYINALEKLKEVSEPLQKRKGQFGDRRP